jgi:TolB-like protein/Flp pilus assembly protein TadD
LSVERSELNIERCAPRGAVFLSYAREDTEAARRICEALRSAGVEVWFDQSELRGGDAWDQKIRRQIKDCALFLPLISAQTQERGEGYFRLEWKLAVERSHLIAEGVPFLVPVVIDDTPENAGLVPEPFLRVQWTRLPGALPTPQFVAQVQRLLEAPKKASVVGRGLPTPPPTRGTSDTAGSGDPALQSRPASRLPVILGAIAAVAVAAAVYFALRPAGKDVAAPAAPPQQVTPAAAAPAAPAVDAKSIAVLPFSNMSEDKDTGFFADGVHEDLLTNLALVAELKVVSRTSVMQYRGTTKTIRQIGQELGVAYVLEGSVRRAGNKVRVTGQLINTRTDQHVWARSYDKDLTDIFAIQAALSQEIAGALSAAISPQTQKFLERRPTDNPVAYDFYLKGRDSRNRSPTSSAPHLREAEGLFKGAVQQDPNFAAAWGELAVVHALNAFWGFDGSAARLAEADAAIAQAVRLAPEAPDVIRLLGTYAYYAHRDYARATEQYEKLVRLQPNDPTVFSSLSLILRRQGRWAESLGYIRRALELDPGNISYLRNSLSTLKDGRRWDELRAAQRRLVALLPEKLREQFDLADFEFTATGSLQAADDLLARLSPAERDSPVGIFYRKNWAVDRGDYAEFKRLDQLQPAFEEAEWPALSAILAATVYWVEGAPAAVRARLAPQLAELQGRVEREPTGAIPVGMLGEMEALLGRPEEAMRHIRQAMELVPDSRDSLDGPTYRYTLAQIYALTGDKEQAIAELTRLLRVPMGSSVANIRVDPAFVKLHGDPRFEALLNDPKNHAPLF